MRLLFGWGIGSKLDTKVISFVINIIKIASKHLQANIRARFLTKENALFTLFYANCYRTYQRVLPSLFFITPAPTKTRSDTALIIVITIMINGFKTV